MALKKSVSTDLGVTAEYWRIDALSLRCFNNFNGIGVEVSLYLDAASQTAGNQPLKSESFSMELSSAELDQDSNILSILYPKLKALPEFSGAEDC
jgi:hypothetical protein